MALPGRAQPARRQAAKRVRGASALPDSNDRAKARVQAAREHDPRYGQCSRCSQYVLVKESGDLRGHRAGKRPDNWPCPGI